MSDSKTPIIIVGTGLAGYTLAKEIRKIDKETPILMVTKDDGHSYSKPMLSTGFTKGKTADDLSMADPAKMAEQQQLTIRTFCEITAVDTDKHLVFIDDEAIQYSKLVLATGALVNRLVFPGSDHPKVVSINDLMDYRQFRDLVNEGDKVLIMGAGLIGCEYANDLLSGNFDITVIDPSKQPMNGLIPDFAGKTLQAALERNGVKVIMEDYVSEISETEEGLSARLNSGEQLNADIIISAVGLKPDLALAQSAGIECNRGIKTNRMLETSAADVYALGDCAEVDGRVLLYVLPLMAASRALAKTLTGTPSQVSYGVMPVATKTPVCPIVVNPPLTDEGHWEVDQDGDNIVGKFVSDEGTLLGFVLTGDCIKEKQSLSKLSQGIHAP